MLHAITKLSRIFWFSGIKASCSIWVVCIKIGANHDSVSGQISFLLSFLQNKSEASCPARVIRLCTSHQPGCQTAMQATSGRFSQRTASADTDGFSLPRQSGYATNGPCFCRRIRHQDNQDSRQQPFLCRSILSLRSGNRLSLS